MIHAFLMFHDWLFHPDGGEGYQFWSGIGSDLGELTLVTMLGGGMVAWYRHHNCTEQGCRRLGHPDPEHGHPICHKHQRKLNAGN